MIWVKKASVPVSFLAVSYNSLLGKTVFEGHKVKTLK